jgi:hypothetical protein
MLSTAAAAAGAVTGGVASADTFMREPHGGAGPGTVYVAKGNISCSDARATVQGGVTGPKTSVGVSSGQEFDYNGVHWSESAPAPGESDQCYHIWNDGTGVELA